MNRERQFDRVVVVINGAFGVGKTTVSQLLRKRLGRSREFDPERIGYVLRRLPAAVPFSSAALDDYRNSAAWRTSAVWVAGLLSRIARPLIMPMALDAAHLNPIRDGLTAVGCHVVHFCLVASERTVHARLAARGVSPGSEAGRWVYPRASLACRTHAAPEYARHIDTERVTPDRIVDQIVALLRDGDSHTTTIDGTPRIA